MVAYFHIDDYQVVYYTIIMTVYFTDIIYSFFTEYLTIFPIFLRDDRIQVYNLKCKPMILLKHNKLLT